MKTCILSPTQILEKTDDSIINSVEKTVKETIEKYNLITQTDKVIVAVSGGKDSTTLLHILNKLGYKIEAFTVDVHIGCYTEQNLANVKQLCEKESVKLHVFSFRKTYGHSICHARDTLNSKGVNVNSCTVCGVMRRRMFNIIAKKTGATKMATGHNLDDEAQSILMNIFKNRTTLNARISPLQQLKNTDMVPRIKPLFFVTEDEIIQYSKARKFFVHYGRCPCSVTSLRSAVRDFLNECKQLNPNATQNIMNFFMKNKQHFCKKQHKEIQTCANCGQPTVSLTCRTCELLQQIKMPAQSI
ncbi:TIGR00269 family protein [Candidatus Woesearchaeota archaeon]|nr:TIGR00269 family protein [Candidatus Woesearchaeota archaeon]